MCRCQHLLHHTHLPATKIKCPGTFLVIQIPILPERLPHLTTGRARLRCLSSIKDDQTGLGHYLWLTRLTLGVNRYLLRLPHRDIQRVDLFLKVEWSTMACPITTKLHHIMLHLATGLGSHNMTRRNPHLDLMIIWLQHLLTSTSTHPPGHLDPEEPHLPGPW